MKTMKRFLSLLVCMVLVLSCAGDPAPLIPNYRHEQNFGKTPSKPSSGGNSGSQQGGSGNEQGSGSGSGNEQGSGSGSGNEQGGGSGSGSGNEQGGGSGSGSENEQGGGSGSGNEQGGGSGSGNEQGGGTAASASVSTGDASGITVEAAVLSGSFSAATSAPREMGFEWGTSATSLPNVLQSTDIVTTTSGSFTARLDDLGDGHTYWYRAYVVIPNGSDNAYFYGPVKSFTTLVEQAKPTGGDQVGWFELPRMDITKSGNYMVNTNDNNLYYAYHMCAGGEIGPLGRTARNYTVCYSATHHSPLWVAAPLHSMYKSQGRHDAYKPDPDIPAGIQWSSTGNAKDFNKGHILGSSDRNISEATNHQVFYYSNIAAQMSDGFNTGGGGWNTLEDWVDKQMCSDTLYAVIGCIYKTITDGYGYTVTPRTLNGWGRDDVAMPTAFYYVLMRTKSGNSRKSLANCTSDEIKCAVFLRAHANQLKGQKVTSAEMMSVTELEAITGQTYFPNVPNAPKSTFSAADWGLAE